MVVRGHAGTSFPPVRVRDEKRERASRTIQSALASLAFAQLHFSVKGVKVWSSTDTRYRVMVLGILFGSLNFCNFDTEYRIRIRACGLLRHHNLAAFSLRDCRMVLIGLVCARRPIGLHDRAMLGLNQG